MVRSTNKDVAACDLCETTLTCARRVPGLESAALLQCGTCGLVITSPRPTKEEIDRHYPDNYYAHVLRAQSPRQKMVDRLKSYKGHYPTDDPPLARGFWRIASSFLQGFFLYDLPYLGEGRRLLDIGSGVGDSLVWAKEHGWDVYGIEMDANAVEIARKLGLANVQCGTFEAVKYPDGYFDAITMYQVLEHVYSPTEVLSECQRILRPDGYVILALPNFDSYPRVLLNELWHALELPRHLYHFTQQSLSRLVDKCGFDPAEIRFYSRSVALLLNAISLRNTVKTLRRDNPHFSVMLLFGRLIRSIGSLWGRADLRVADVMLYKLRKKAST